MALDTNTLEKISEIPDNLEEKIRVIDENKEKITNIENNINSILINKQNLIVKRIIGGK